MKKPAESPKLRHRGNVESQKDKKVYASGEVTGIVRDTRGLVLSMTRTIHDRDIRMSIERIQSLIDNYGSDILQKFRVMDLWADSQDRRHSISTSLARTISMLKELRQVLGAGITDTESLGLAVNTSAIVLQEVEGINRYMTGKKWLEFIIQIHKITGPFRI